MGHPPSIGDGSVYSVSIPSSGGYAPDSDILAANDSVNGNWNYAYDGFNRLATSSVNSGATTYGYAYDRFGNRWQQNVTHGTGTPSSLGFDANNRITSSYGVSYDAAGDTSSDGTTTYTYDGEGRIATANNGSNGTSTYVYDAEGRRIRKTTVAGGAVDFLYDLTGHELLQISSTGAWTRGEIYAGGRHVATYSGGTGGTTSFIQADWLGTERARSSVAGVSSETCTSLPFGDALACTGTDVSPMHFTGKGHDTETGLENFGARYDSSGMGRFMTPDWSGKPQGVPYAEFGDPQSFNLYGYVRNNPVTRADADGHCLEDACIAEGLAVAAAVSTAVGIYKFVKWAMSAISSENSPANQKVIDDITHPNEHPDQTIEDQTKEIQNSTLDPQKQAKDTLEGISAGAGVLGATPEGETAGATEKVVGALVEGNNRAVGNTAEKAAQSLQNNQGSQTQHQQQQKPPTPPPAPPPSDCAGGTQGNACAPGNH